MALFLCDLHMHSALSPCAENDMTPGNMVSMAFLNGLEVIAITDHCSSKNCAAAIECSRQLKAEQGRAPLVIPGMEIEVAEGFHVLGLFPDCERAMEFDAFLTSRRPKIKNRVEIFGNQYVMNDDDEVVEEIENLLSTGSDVSMIELYTKLDSLGAAAIPAHIDKDSYSMVASLGTVPEEWKGRLLEVSKRCNLPEFWDAHPELATYHYIVDSDAHQLVDIADPGYSLKLPIEKSPDLDAATFVNALRDLMRK
ncbi:MAG: PHP domain-containing protein [Clostridiales bacterium]|nr:PHP domain-containing protein [Clostridiales bacterium]